MGERKERKIQNFNLVSLRERERERAIEWGKKIKSGNKEEETPKK